MWAPNSFNCCGALTSPIIIIIILLKDVIANVPVTEVVADWEGRGGATKGPQSGSMGGGLAAKGPNWNSRGQKDIQSAKQMLIRLLAVLQWLKCGREVPTGGGPQIRPPDVFQD